MAYSCTCQIAERSCSLVWTSPSRHWLLKQTPQQLPFCQIILTWTCYLSEERRQIRSVDGHPALDFRSIVGVTETYSLVWALAFTECHHNDRSHLGQVREEVPCASGQPSSFCAIHFRFVFECWSRNRSHWIISYKHLGFHLSLIFDRALPPFQLG